MKPEAKSTVAKVVACLFVILAIFQTFLLTRIMQNGGNVWLYSLTPICSWIAAAFFVFAAFVAKKK